jgi:hypothetical protein
MEEKIVRKDNEILDHPENSSGMTIELQQLTKESWEEICEYRRLLDALDYQKCLLELEKVKNEQLR